MVEIKQFYKELGRLLYSVAMVDGRIEAKEVLALHEFVSKELAHFKPTSDSSGMNHAFYVEFEFDEYANHGMNIHSAYDSFMKYFEAHVTEIDPQLVTMAIDIVEKVASSFMQMNREERELIDRIKKEMAETADIV